MVNLLIVNGEICSFLNLDKRFKAFQLIRDPRAVLVSFKKITFEKKT